MCVVLVLVEFVVVLPSAVECVLTLVFVVTVVLGAVCSGAVALGVVAFEVPAALALLLDALALDALLAFLACAALTGAATYTVTTPLVGMVGFSYRKAGAGW